MEGKPGADHGPDREIQVAHPDQDACTEVLPQAREAQEQSCCPRGRGRRGKVQSASQPQALKSTFTAGLRSKARTRGPLRVCTGHISSSRNDQHSSSNSSDSINSAAAQASKNSGERRECSGWSGGSNSSGTAAASPAASSSTTTTTRRRSSRSQPAVAVGLEHAVQTRTQSRLMGQGGCAGWEGGSPPPY